MNTGQMMITIGAMLFLAVMVLNVNKGFNNTSAVLTDSKLRVLAISEATSIFEEATSKAFDNKTDTASVSSTSSLTAVASLGLESGESSSYSKGFNDFDDYKCYKTTPRLDSIRIMTANPKMVFKIFCDVNYVVDTLLSTKSTSPTWHKRMDIKVTSDAMVKSYYPTISYDTVKMSIVYSYWYFR
jgi:hypothetical protein